MLVSLHISMNSMFSAHFHELREIFLRSNISTDMGTYSHNIFYIAQAVLDLWKVILCSMPFVMESGTMPEEQLNKKS